VQGSLALQHPQKKKVNMMKKTWYFIPIFFFLLIVLTACQLYPFITVLKSETVTVTHEKALTRSHAERGNACLDAPRPATLLNLFKTNTTIRLLP